jgi:hypothetical protein
VKCPKCKATNENTAAECGQCGVVFADVRRSFSRFDQQASPGIPERCEYEDLGMRCRYHAAKSPSTVGGGPWFCKWHFRERGTPAAFDILRASQSYSEEVGEIPSTEYLDGEARRIADRFGVDQNMQPADRARAVYRAAMLKTGRVAPAHREPGED